MRRFFIVLAAVFAIFTATASAERTGTKYLKHITGWYGVDCEKIYTPSDKLTFYLDSGDFTAQLGAEAMPINTTDKKLTYSSSDESIVTVDENGTVTLATEPLNGFEAFEIHLVDSIIPYAGNNEYVFVESFGQTEYTVTP